MDKDIKKLFQDIKEKKIQPEEVMKKVQLMRQEGSGNRGTSETESVQKTQERQITVEGALPYFKKLLSEGIKLNPDKIDEDSPMERYGIDSVMILDLTQRLEKVFGSLPKTLFFEYQTIRELTEYFCEKHADQLAELLHIAPDVEAEKPMDRMPKAEPKTDSKPPVKQVVAAPKKEKEKATKKTDNMDVAIVGLAGKYPKAQNVNELWNNLTQGMNCITQIPKDRWDHMLYFDPQKGKAGKTYSKWGGFVDGVYEFDPLFFKISPREAQQIDPQERLFLECVYATLEDAGYTRDSFKKPGVDGKVGVFVGVMYEEYQLYAAQEQARGNHIAVNGNPSSIANRVSYYFDFHGPSMSVDTMCSSSLTALHIACQSLKSGECELAIAGGVNVSVHPNKYLLLGMNNFLSSKGLCESFGEGGDGYVPGEGVGAVLLKPLDKAVEDGDIIYGVIKGTSLNHGGKTNGFTVPNPKAQAAVIQTAYQNAQVNPRTVSYIEAHGTGTSLGDPIEISGLNKVFQSCSTDKHFCKIGSIKSNIGHLESAAGMASLTKVLLQMKYHKLVPSIHSEKLNPNIDFEDTPFVVQRSLEDWNRPVITVDGIEKEYPRIAGISAFGAGGSNAHVIIEEYLPEQKTIQDIEYRDTEQIFVYSAKNKKQLLEILKQQKRYIETGLQQEKEAHTFADMAYTLQLGREIMNVRVAIVASSYEELLEKLSACIEEKEEIQGVYKGSDQLEGLGKVFEGSASTVFIQSLIAQQELNKIAQLWASGVEIDWNLLWEDEQSCCPHRISLPGYVFEKNTYFPKLTDTFQIPSVEMPESQESISQRDEFYYIPKWVQEEASGIQTEESERRGRHVFIIYSEEAKRLSQELSSKHREDQVIRIKQGTVNRKLSETEYEVDYQDTDAFVAPFEHAERMDVIYFLGGIVDNNQDITDLAYAKEMKERGMLGLFRLAKTLMKLGYRKNKTAIKIVTNHVYAVMGSDKTNPLAAGLFGFGKSFEKEYRSAHITGIDVDYDRDMDQAALEMMTERMIEESSSLSLGTIAIRRGLRFVQKLYQASLPVPQDTQFKENGVYFLLGGAGGIGLELCQYIANNIHCRFVLVGRRKPEDIPQDAISQITKSGSEVYYIQADATNEESMRQAVEKAKEKFGTINGVIHSAIVLKDQSILNMDEAVFNQVYDPKANGSIILYNVFKEEPIDFKMYFSSAQSFVGNGGQSNYAAGCSFKDSFAMYEDRNMPYAVKVINWGYWGEVGIVANDSYKERLDELGLHSMQTKDGMKAIETMLSYSGSQAVAIQAEPKFMEQMGTDFTAKIFYVDGKQDSVMKTSLLYEEMPVLQDQEIIEIEDSFKQLRAYSQLLILEIFQKAQVFVKAGEVQNREELFQSLGVIKKYERLFGAMLNALENGGFVTTKDKKQYISTEQVENSQVQEKLNQLESIKDDIMNQYPLNVAYMEFLWTCRPHYWDILKGVVPATDIVFPNASMKLVEKIYRENILSDYMNEVVTWCLIRYIQNRQNAHSSQDKIRILEIGAGTGGTSSVVFKQLKNYGEIVEYDYTDISDAFLKYGKKLYGAENPYVQFKIFNVESNPVAQGYDAGTYDIIVATNVLHATKNMKNTIRNAKILLKKNGLAIVNEITRVEDFLTLTFGLLDGWWLYDDERLDGSPLLSNELWAELFHQLGYENASAYGQKSDAYALLTQNVIVAESNGEALLYQTEEAEVKNEKVIEKKVEKKKELTSKQPKTVSVKQAPAAKKVVVELSDDELQERVEDAILESLSDVLQIEKAELDLEMPFTEYGVDSILSGQIVNAVNESVGTNMNSTVLFNYPNTSKLAEFILQNDKEALRKLFQKEEVTEPVAEEIMEQYEEEVEELVPEKETEPQSYASEDMPYEKEEVSKSHASDKSGQMDIAIVGMAGVYPGADNLEQYWDNLVHGVDSVTTIDRWGDFYDPAPNVKEKSYINQTGLLRGMKEFDPLFFNISPREAQYMDPQQRLFLEAAWNALEDAGFNDQYLNERKCGVYVGCMEDYYEKVIEESGAEKNSYEFNGITIPFLSARISYLLNLRGPSVVVSTACSSSLVAVHQACESIINQTSEIAIAGGVNAFPTKLFHVVGSSTGMFSYTNEMRPFDNDADGFIPAEGCGAFVLKSLEAAKRDGDHIYGVIIGSGLNQDGKSNGITAPSAPSQAALEVEVYEKYHINPEQITYIEAHGTGTKLGDPIEIEALRESFSKFTDKKQFCAIGSVKANVGHALQAAGSASLAKVLLCLKNKKLVPTIHFNKENELIPFKESPVYVNTEYKEWIPAENAPRIAAISAFGISGTNSHIVLREYNEPESIPEKKESAYLIGLSAKTEEQLEQKMKDLVQWIDKNMDENMLGNIAYTMMEGRSHFAYRIALIVSSVKELKESLVSMIGQGTPSNCIRGGFISNTFRVDRSKKQSAEELIKALSQGTYVGSSYSEKLTELGKLYVEGYRLDWSPIYSNKGYQKLSMPTYPFTHAEYWIMDENSKKKAVVTSAKRLHPLVGENTATLREQRYTTTFSKEEFFIQGHQIGDNKVMPGVAYLEMARAAGTFAAEADVVTLKNVVWGTPIMVKDEKEVSICLEPVAEDEVEFSIYTEEEEERTVHASGKLLYEEEEDSYLDIKAIRSRCSFFQSKEDCYKLFETFGFHYDKNFQAIKFMYSNEKEVIAYLSLPEGLSEDADEFQIHPSIMDGALQAAIGLIQNYQHNGSSAYLPFLIEKTTIHKPLTKNCIVYVTPASDSVKDRTNGFQFNVILTNESGEVLVTVDHYMIREFQPKDNQEKYNQQDVETIQDEDMTEYPEESLSLWEDE